MDIRSVTFFCEADYGEGEHLKEFLAAARVGFHVPVQTTRLALPPFPDWWDTIGGTAENLASHWQGAGFDYISLGPVQLDHDAAWIERLPEIIGAVDTLFASVEIADLEGQIDVGRCLAAAKLIREASKLYDNGFGNLYLAALANCPPGSPFFPVAYHGGGSPHFAIAVESADLAVTAIRSAGSLAAARQILVAAIEREAAQVTAAADALSARFGYRFSGIDFSLAPFPEDEKSLAG
ncbi:MAG: DUF711 family protein, partial [Candidatus Promineifilaceae bacterium]